MQLQRWEQQLLQQEQQAFEVHPMLEQRREQLMALLGTEQIWMEQRGIAPPVQMMPLPPAQEPMALLLSVPLSAPNLSHYQHTVIPRFFAADN